jgi:tetratricopeptide (TPR) repeat protein
VANGERSPFVLGEDELRKRLAPVSPDRLMADAEFTLAEYLYHAGHGPEAIPHFKEAQRLAPDNWNYKRQAWLLSDADRDYGTNFAKEVEKLNGKPYYPPRQMGDPAKDRHPE